MTAELAALHATLAGIGDITRPEPGVRALVFVQAHFGPIGHELRSPGHGHIVQGHEDRVKTLDTVTHFGADDQRADPAARLSTYSQVQDRLWTKLLHSRLGRISDLQDMLDDSPR